MLFTFAVITDTHIRPPEGDHSSPFPVNKLANGRARFAVELIKKQNPDFTIHLGDMVHPLPHLPSYGSAAKEALEILNPLSDKLYFVPGNHDIGDKPMESSPAGGITDESYDNYKNHFGTDRNYFEYKGCHFVTINSSLVNTDTEQELEQREWLENKLAGCSGERIFLFTHYPPFIDEAVELVHYDNYAEPGRSWLLSLIKEFKIEAVFSGHVHQFFFNRINSCNLYCLPPTSFVRQDYSELYRISPTAEFGRNDTGKFSITLVDIFPKGHKVRLLPTDGKGLSPNESCKINLLHPVPQKLSLHMRHAWAESVDLPYNGPMEEFSRKRARNDYVLARLWQMGIKNVRTSVNDILDPSIRTRAADFAAAGISFSLFSLSIPDQPTMELFNKHRSIISSLELISESSNVQAYFDQLSKVSIDTKIPVYIGKSHSSAHEKKRGSNFAHSVSSGFLWSEREYLAASLQNNSAEFISGFVFQLNLKDEIEDRLHEIHNFCEERDLLAMVNVRLACQNPAEENFNDDLIAERVMRAAELSNLLSRLIIQIDTLVDIDRGYNPRHGLLDRHYNFRRAGRFLAGLDGK